MGSQAIGPHFLRIIEVQVQVKLGEAVTRMDLLDVEGRTFCSPQLSEMSFRLPFTDGEGGQVVLSEGS